MKAPYTKDEIVTIVDQLVTSDSPATNALKVQVESTGLEGEAKSAFIAKLRENLIKNMTDGADPAVLPTEENKENEKKKENMASNMSSWFGNLLGMFSGTLQTLWSFVSSFMPDAVTNLFSKPAEQVVSLTNGESQDEAALKRQEAGIYNALVTTTTINNGKRVGITDPGIVMEIIANARNNGLLNEEQKPITQEVVEQAKAANTNVPPPQEAGPNGVPPVGGPGTIATNPAPATTAQGK